MPNFSPLALMVWEENEVTGAHGESLLIPIKKSLNSSQASEAISGGIIIWSSSDSSNVIV